MTEPETPLVERTGVLAGDPALLRERDTALGALATVRAPSLAPLVRATAVGDAHALTHLVPADAVELAAVRDVVPLRPGHVVTVLGAVLDALDAVHRAHLAHGGVTAERVLVAADGAVVLAGAGLTWAVPPGQPAGPTAPDDVAAVAVLARGLLGPGSAPPALVLALLRAADPDPLLRPDAADLAATVRDALPAEPLLDLLWLTTAAHGPAAVAVPPSVPVPVAAVADEDRHGPLEAPPAARRPGGTVLRPAARRRSRRGPGLVVGLAAVALPLLAWAALRAPSLAAADQSPPQATALGPSAPASPLATAAPSTSTAVRDPDAAWGRVLARLDALRLRAVTEGSTTLLARAVDPAGSAWADDAALVGRIRRSGAVVTGGALVRTAVEALAVEPSRVRLRVHDIRAAYAVARAGRTERVPARGDRTWEVTLLRSGAGWRIGDVLAVAGTSTGQ